MRPYLLLLCLVILLQLVSAGRRHGFRKRKRGRCQEALGMETGAIPDTALSASSYHTSLEPKYARLRVTDDTGGGAWCPQGLVTADTYTYLQITFPRLMVLTRIETQGRHARGEGREFTEGYRLEYQRRDGEQWRRFYHRDGHEIFPANSDTYTSVFHDLFPPLITRRVRVIPAPTSPKPVCLRLEIYGCQWQDELVAYNVRKPQNYQLTSKRQVALRDNYYDGTVGQRWLQNGVGKLTDLENGNSRWNKRGSAFVGWKRTTTDFLKFEFQFDSVRNFSQMALYAVADKKNKIDLFKSAVIGCGYDGSTYLQKKTVFQNDAETWDNEAAAVLVPLNAAVCRWLRVTLEYRKQMEWLLLSEVYFTSEPVSPSFIIPQITTTTTTTTTSKPAEYPTKQYEKAMSKNNGEAKTVKVQADNETVAMVVLSDERLVNRSGSSSLITGAFRFFPLSILVVIVLFMT